MSTLLHITLSATVSPVQSGIRATKLGYTSVGPYTLEGVWGFHRSGDKALYSGIFFPEGTHMTWQFKPGKCVLPIGVAEGGACQVTVIGEYKDSEVHCLVVTLPDGTNVQP